MKCPKCSYLSFDSGERCRNCGYDFSLAIDPATSAELPIRVNEPIGPYADLALHPPGNPGSDPDGRASADELIDLERAAQPSATPLTELPLFHGEGGSARSFGAPPAARSPLAVRRATPEPGRMRSRPPRRKVDEPRLELEPPPARDLGAAGRPGAPLLASTPMPCAGALDRVLAGLIDLSLMAAIDVAVLYFTLRLCNLTAAEIAILPKPPLLGFLALLHGGYFVAFTLSSGQTIGKMLRGIKVVGVRGPVHAGQAVLRTAAYGASALPFGLGFVAGCLGRDRLAFHDRLAETRVVKIGSP